MREAMIVGRIGPNGAESRIRIISKVMVCRKCQDTRLFVKLRPWPGESFQIGECAKCGNTQASFPFPKRDDAPGAA